MFLRGFRGGFDCWGPAGCVPSGVWRRDTSGEGGIAPGGRHGPDRGRGHLQEGMASVAVFRPHPRPEHCTAPVWCRFPPRGLPGGTGRCIGRTAALRRAVPVGCRERGSRLTGVCRCCRERGCGDGRPIPQRPVGFPVVRCRFGAGKAVGWLLRGSLSIFACFPASRKRDREDDCCGRAVLQSRESDSQGLSDAANRPILRGGSAVAE